MDHAGGLAQAMSRQLDRPVLELLSNRQSRDEKPQKEKSQSQRREIEFVALQGVPSGSFGIVDDVTTTGATVRAAWEALGRPRNCSVWCLANRGKLVSHPSL